MVVSFWLTFLAHPVHSTLLLLQWLFLTLQPWLASLDDRLTVSISNGDDKATDTKSLIIVPKEFA